MNRLAARGVAVDGFNSHSIAATSAGHGLILGFGSVTNAQLSEALPIVAEEITL